MKKIVVLLMIAAAAGFWLVPKWTARAVKGQDSGLETRATTGTVETRDIDFAVTVAGEIGPAEQVSVRPEVNGRIAELPVDIGDKVKKGQLLFSLDDRDTQIEIGSREAEITTARLQLEKARRDFERDKQLYEENLVSREVFENSRTNFELAENAIQKADQGLALARERLAKTRIEAPFDCTVLTRPLSAGQAVSGSGGFNSGTEVLTIANLNDMIVNAHVNQVDVTRLKAGSEVAVQVEAVPGLKVKGQVERIAPQATIKNGIKGFSARVLIKEIDPRVQPGMTANLTIPVASASNILTAPLAAVFTEYNSESGQMERFAYVKKGEGFEKRPVRIGISDYFHVEVLAGLEKGDVVSLEPPPGEEVARPASSQAVGGPRAGGGRRSGT